MPADARPDPVEPRRRRTIDPPGDRDAARRSAHAGRRLWFVCALFVLGTIITGCGATWWRRETALTNSERELSNLGIVLAEQTSRTLQSVDLILREVQSRSATLGLRTPEQFHTQFANEDTHRFLTDHLRNLPQADAIALIAANGMLLNWSRDFPVPLTDFSNRDYFRYLSTHDDDATFISEPAEGRFSGKTILFLARRVDAPDGTFMGIVTGLIDTRYLEDFYGTISMVPGEIVTVLRRDGIVIAGHPDIENRRGKRMPPQSPWYARVAEGGGFYFSPGYLIDTPQIITVHPLHDYPLVVDANVSVAAALENWYQQTVIIAAVVTGASAGLIVLFAVIIGQFRRQEEQNILLNHSEAALRASERRFKAYAEMSADWFWEQNADLRFVRDSSSPNRTGDAGKTRWDLSDPAMDPRRWEAHLEDLAARRPFRDFRWERIQNDGKRHYISISGDPFYDESGTFLGYQGTGRDVTADVEAAEALHLAKDRAEAANRAKSEFLTNMSHELRTPLHAIIGFSELIQVHANGAIDEKYVAWAGDILASGRHLLDVINGVLELSRIEAGRYDLSDEPVNLASVVETCAGMVRLQAEENQVRVDGAIEELEILADRQALTQIVLNLLTNAVKFTPAGGAVSVRTELDAHGGVAMIVTDTGIGIEPEVLASLGEPFVQADASVRRRYGGSGLGLAISRKLMALHDGTLTIDSTPGQGTSVRITFPAARVIAKARHASVGAPI